MLKSLKDWLSGHRAVAPRAGGQDVTALIAEAHQRLEAGELASARELCERVMTLAPGNGRALMLAGNVAEASGDRKATLDYLRQAVAADPGAADFHYRLGCALQDAGSLDEAIAAYRSALALDPGLGKAHNNLGCLLEAQGDADAAAAAYRQALIHDPRLAHAHYNLGNLFRQHGQPDEAIECFRRALALEPGKADWHCNLGNVLHREGRVSEAIDCYRESIRLDPDVAIAYMDLGNALTDQGRHLEAEHAYRMALERNPTLAEAHSNILFTLHYGFGDDPERMFNEHLLWARQHAWPLYRTIRRHDNPPDRGRRLRIGYLSPDFRRHSVSFFVEPILAGHDRTHFEVFAYSDVARADDLTARLKALADQWRDISEFGHDEVAELVRRDSIDILVDLAGHTGNNRMLALARKPAPIQVSYLGYPNTTGLSTMDYRITDGDADPEGITDRYHVERLVRLREGFLCYRPAHDSPAVVQPPSLARGTLRFGSFNNFVKITDRIVGLWSRIFHEVPDSELMLKGNGLRDPNTRRDLLARFGDCGIAPERIILRGPVSGLSDHLACYHEVDVALDVFPYNGATTTCEALWMGVPVVTLAGTAHVTRVGASILNRIGLRELIASTPEDYLAKAVELARDPERLCALRAGLRQRMLDSPLCDPVRFVAALEEAYREMWLDWCDRQAEAPGPGTGGGLRLHRGGTPPRGG